MKLKLLTILLTLLAIFFMAVIGVQAQQNNPSDDQINAVAKKLYCPVCPNTPLDVCETKACDDWRAQIRDELSAGWSEQQIIDYFVAQYGERVLAEPQRTGFTSLVWMLPVLAILFGLVLVWQVLKNWRVAKQKSVLNPPPASVSPETLARIEKELQEMK